MAWLELHQSASRHPKILALAKAMGWNRREALGTMADLWLWALDYASDGHLGAHGAVVIAAALELDADAETFWTALHAARLVDADDRIHDWEDYAGRLLVMREGNRRRQRESYKKSARRLRKDCKKSATLPTNQPTNQPDTTEQDTAATPSASFSRWYAVYPRKVARGAAEKAWAKIKPDDGLVDRMVEAVREQVRWRESAKPGEFRPEWKHPASWLNAKSWLDEVVDNGNGSPHDKVKCGSGEMIDRELAERYPGLMQPRDTTAFAFAIERLKSDRRKEANA